jgi:hypothetical protein
MRLRLVVTLLVLLFMSDPTKAAEPSKSDPTAAPIESLTAKVRALLTEPSPAYPDPWKPRRERPNEFLVLPGEKMTYAERLTAMGLAGLANRDGPRLFIRGHFGFNADADRFWLVRLAEQYGMNHREVSLDEAL